jgi:hypothetical protein
MWIANRIHPEEMNGSELLTMEGRIMFMPVLESMGKITGATVDFQQEIYKKWFSMFPGVPGIPPYPAAYGEQVQRLQKKWVEIVSDLIRRQRESIDAQFKAGQQNIEKAFQIGEVKNPEELRARTIELWQKCFEAVRQASEAQVRDFTVAIEKWVELMTTPVPNS